MYQSENDLWVAENADWKQLSILIHYILNEEIVNYHGIQIFRDTYSDLFLYTLFSEGKAYVCILLLVIIICCDLLQGNSTKLYMTSG